MGYKYILCDADDTLLDFAAAERQAFKESCVEFGAIFTDEIYSRYHEINDSHWKKLELGMTTRDRLKRERFEELFRETGILPTGLADDFAVTYIENLSHQSQLFPGVLDILAKLCKKYSIYIITNGATVAQHGRLDSSPVMDYAKGLFISEEIGAAKPSKDYFDYVINAVGDTNMNNYIVVGDSPSSDIKGALNCGMDSCLITNGKEYKDHGQTYTLKYFTDILSVL